MKLKEIIIFLVIAALLGGGLFWIQNRKQNKALITHNKNKFLQIREAMKKNNAAGMGVMASAINTYKKTNGHYPKTLLDLYPKSIPDKAFITEPDWDYSRKGDNSYLLKIDMAGQNTVASMGPDLRLKIKDYASAEKAVEFVAENKTIPQKTKIQKVTIAENLNTKPALKKQVKMDRIVKKSSPRYKKEKTPQPRPSVTVVKKALEKDEEFLLSLATHKYYIWKTKEGFIGFSNIQYPDKKEIAIYSENSWIEYRRHNR